VKKKLVLLSVLVLALASACAAQYTGNSLVTLTPNGSDYCQNPSVPKSVVAVNISGAAGVNKIVSAVAGKNVYVCGLLASVVGTSPTIKFTAGTQTTTPCDTGATQQSGDIAVPTTTIINWPGSGEKLIALGVVGKDFCITAGGTTPSIQGTLTYVQK